MAGCKWIGYTLLVVILTTAAESKRGYMLTFPSQLQIGAEEKFCLTLYNLTSPVTLHLNISCYGRSVEKHQETFQHDEFTCITWRLPDSITAGTCSLEVQGSDETGDYTFEESKEVQMVDTHQITFVHTDRPVYKPGDQVRFRILTVTQELTPLQAKIDSVTVQDPRDFYMKQWYDVPVTSGLASLEYQLYSEPVLGDWKIVAVVNGRRTEHVFPVQQYVLPKFQVNTQLPEGLTVETKDLEFRVCARYVFGMPVVGKMNATVCLHNQEHSWFCEKNIRPCTSYTSKIDGCHTFKVETKHLSLTDRSYPLLCKPRLSLDVNVTEKNTGFTARETQEGTDVWEERVKLQFVSPKYFKPYFPYTGKLKAVLPDGTPAVEEEITLTIGRLGIQQKLTTDHTGHLNFTITNLTHITDFFILNAKTMDKEEIDTKLYTIYPASAKLHVKQWYSPTSSYLHLSTNQEGPLSCGQHVTIEAIYSLQPDVTAVKMYYQTLSKGNILTSEDLNRELSASRPYKFQHHSPVLVPDFTNEHSSPLDEPGFLDNNLPRGPPGSLKAPPGPPGMITQPSPPAPPKAVEDLGSSSGLKLEEVTPDKEWVTPDLWRSSWKVKVTSEMSPVMRVLAYIITDQGEMVADTIDFKVTHCHRNKVKLSMKEKSARPGESVHLDLHAAPNSICSVTMVDKSSLLLAGVNLLQDTEVNDRLEEFDLTSDFVSDWKYCSDLSDMPPLLNSDLDFRGGPPGIHDDMSLPPSSPFRKKRSIMQFYSNMYDSLLAFKVAGVTTLTDLDLQTRPCIHSGDLMERPFNPGDPRGPVPGYTGDMDVLKPADEPKDESKKVSNFRKHFPENWLWDLYTVPSNGSLNLVKTLPDAVTEWVGNSFCSNDISGLGVSSVARVTGFQSFFMSIKLPYSVIRGEIAHLDVTVFNYLPHCTALQVNLIKTGSFIVEANKEKEPFFCICSGKSATYTFKIRPQVLGKISLTFSAFLREHRISCGTTQAPIGYAKKQATDLVMKELLVEAEGVTEETSTSQFICPQDFSGTFKETVVPSIPQDLLVPNSLIGWVNVIGDIMGPVLSGVEDLLLLPTGCGEQNIIRMAPNVGVLEYLRATNQLTDSIEIKTLDHLNKGYQQQMQFVHPDGSYSAFGEMDDAGSTWLSAFVFKTFQQAMDFIFVDRKQILAKTWEFLINQQGQDGCFNEHGSVLSKYMMGGVIGSVAEKKRALTAYVLASMLESFKMMRERTPPFVALAVRCIEVNNLTDTYTLALTTYAMSLYKPDSTFTSTLMERLLNKAIVQDDTMSWKRDKQPDILSGQGRAASAEIEMTAYALLAMLTKDENIAVSKVIPIVRWLTNQRNAYGGFASTQDTIVALQALSTFARRVYGKGLDVTIDIENGDSEEFQFGVSPENSIILQQRTLGNPEADVHITAKGEGCVMLQTNFRYNIINKVDKADAFSLTVTTPITMEIVDNNCRTRNVRVCASYIGPDEVSNMAVVEVRLTSGWIPDITSLQNLLNSVELGIKKYEVDNSYPGLVNFYFDQLSEAELCFEFSSVLEVTVGNPKPAHVKVFDYYETELQTTVFYELSECSQDHIEKVDVKLEETDLYIEEPAVDNQNTNTVQAEPQTGTISHPGPFRGDIPPDDYLPTPQRERACPKCYMTGVVDIFHDICNRQVWALEPVDTGFALQIVASEGASPELSIPVPLELQHDCQDCQALLFRKGRKALAVLKAEDWIDIGSNIVQADTVVIDWSANLQAAIQEVIGQCGVS